MGSDVIIDFFLALFKDKIIFRCVPKCQYLILIPGFFPSEKGTWARLFHPPVEGKLMRGFKGLDVGDRVRVQLPHFSPLPQGRGRGEGEISDVERGFIDFARAG